MRFSFSSRIAIVAQVAAAAVVVASAVTGVGLAHSHETASSTASHHSVASDSTAAFVSSHSVNVKVPGTGRTVKAIDPSTFGARASEANTQAAIQAQASAASVLSAADYQKAQEGFAEMLAAAPVGATAQNAVTTTSGSQFTAELAATHRKTVTIYRWELEAVGWYYIVSGGTVAAAGAFIDFTGLGIPVGAVLNAIGIGVGITGSFILWYADNKFPDHRTYTITW